MTSELTTETTVEFLNNIEHLQIINSVCQPSIRTAIEPRVKTKGMHNTI